MKREPGRKSRLPWLAAILAALLLAGAWMLLGGGDTRALRLVQAHVDPAIDAQRPLGEVFGGHPHLRPEWVAAWGGDRHCAAVTLHATTLAELDAACPHLLDPLRGLVAMDRRWAGLASDQPLAVQVVFRLDGDGEAPKIEVLQVLAVEAWVGFKPECVADYEKGIEESIAASDDRSRAKRYRLRHDGERALFDIGLNGPSLASAGLASPQVAAQLIAAWR